jgi:hypothetical protein
VNQSIDGVNRKKIESGEGEGNKNEVRKMKRTKKIKNEG